MTNHNNNGGLNSYNSGRANGSWGQKPPNATSASLQGSLSSPAGAAVAAVRSANVKGTAVRYPVQSSPSSPRTPPLAASTTGPVSQDKSVTAAAASTAAGGGGATTAKTLLSCEPCEKDFTSEAARQAHLKSHVPCPEQGCGFSALRKIVNNHHEAKHGQFSGSGFQVTEDLL